MLEVAGAQQSGPLLAEADRVATRLGTFSATPAGRSPRSAAAATTMAHYICTEQYLWGLQRVLDGITARTTGVPKRPETRGSSEDQPDGNRSMHPLRGTGP